MRISDWSSDVCSSDLLSISGSNLDEFFMVRVAGLKGQQLQGVEERSADGLTPVQQLAAIGVKADELMARQQEIWSKLKQELAEAEFYVLDARDLGGEAPAWTQDHSRHKSVPGLELPG